MHLLFGGIFECGRNFLKVKIQTVFVFKNVEAAFKNVTGKSVARQRLYRWLKPAAGNRAAMTFCGYNPGD
ncbi:hypothetical protein AwEntero_27270 [Enterobacterales bacterium]|nr:hypothetical protein AwEntero_27270 [Enterobacterales bacterium]